MKRRIIQIVVLLLLGAIVNIAVAWGPILVVSKVLYSDTLYAEAGLMYNRVVSQAHANNADTEIPQPSMACRNEFQDVFRYSARRPGPDAIGLTIYEYRCGYPWRSLRGTLTKVENFGAWSESGHPQRMSPIVSFEYKEAIGTGRVLRLCQGRDQFVLDSSERLLPLKPMLPGFAINTIFYAAILWLLFFIPGIVQRAIRRRRGLCTACAYPIGSSPVCTECGHKF